MSNLDIKDLDHILTKLRHVPKDKWQELGLKLGLYQYTLDTIETNYRGNVERCFSECLSAWLRREDGVNDKGIPTMSVLADALDDIDRATAGNIRDTQKDELLRTKDKQMQQMLIEIDQLKSSFQSKAGLEETLKKEIEALQEKVSVLSTQLLEAQNDSQAVRLLHSRVPTLHNDWKENHTPPVFITMTSFSSYHKTNEHWFSPSFLSHEGGYRMCLKVRPNGEDEVKGTYLSVSVHLVSGENDNILRWPFSGVVKVVLINRRFDGGIFEKEILFTNENARQRVYNGIPIETGIASFYGQGGIKFIPQKDLAYNSQSCTEYLKDDSIKLKVTGVNVIVPDTVPQSLPASTQPDIKPVAEFLINNFTTRKANNEECISKPFYSHREGYKFVLLVYPNGRGDFKEKSISIFVHLMKGEYDNELKFPFRGEFVVQIVNQVENEGHVEKFIEFSGVTDPDGKYGAQVTGFTTWFSSGRSFQGYGFSNFMSHEYLQYNEDCSTLYLSNDDTMLVRVMEIKVRSMRI